MIISYKEQIKKKVPERMHTEDFKVFLRFIAQHKITNNLKLRAFLNTKQGELQSYLNNHKKMVPQSSGHLRKKAIELDWIKKAKRIFLRYL